MINILYALENSDYDDDKPICCFAYFAKYGIDCINMDCFSCPFYQNMDLIIETLSAEHVDNKEKIKLTKVQYEILKKLYEKYNRLKIGIEDGKIVVNDDYVDFFLDSIGVKSTDCYYKDNEFDVKDILNNCEIVDRRGCE